MNESKWWRKCVKKGSSLSLSDPSLILFVVVSSGAINLGLKEIKGKKSFFSTWAGWFACFHCWSSQRMKSAKGAVNWAWWSNRSINMSTGCGRKDDDSINKELKFQVAFSPPRLLATLIALVESSTTWSSRTFIRTFWGTFIYLYTEFFRKTLAWEKRRYFATLPLVPIWSFCEETSHGVVKCWLFLRLRRPFFN